MLERIVGKPTNPPPPNVPSVEPDFCGAVTLSQKIEKHRELAACASCHARIDPLGFALEVIERIVNTTRDKDFQLRRFTGGY